MALSASPRAASAAISSASISISCEAFYGKATAEAARRSRPPAIAGAARFERHRDRALQHRRPSRPAADQSAHVLLLPLRTADGERRGAECLWRRHLGAVLHLPGLQRTHRLDAHLERRRCGGRVPGNGRQKKGDQLLLQVRQRRAPDDASTQITRAVQDRHAAWPKRNSRSTARITAPSSARRTANGSPSA